MKKGLMFLGIIIMSQFASAHCEIPCGIYNDDARFDMLFEHIHTLEKSAKEITKYEGKKKNAQQFVRWVINKEKHATEIQEIVNQYFLTQRVKPGINQEHYVDLVTGFHTMLVLAMQTKQKPNPTTEISALHAQVEKTQKAYNLYRKSLQSQKKQ